MDEKTYDDKSENILMPLVCQADPVVEGQQ
jgi:hypothetical protein